MDDSSLSINAPAAVTLVASTEILLAELAAAVALLLAFVALVSAAVALVPAKAAASTACWANSSTLSVLTLPSMPDACV